MDMSLAEKVQLYDELWQELEAHFQRMPVGQETIADMDREMEEYRRDPSKGSTWEQVRERIVSRVCKSA
jgi:putative addiction module component (TIGR02574 family)